MSRKWAILAASVTCFALLSAGLSIADDDDSPSGGTGFKFHDYNPDALMSGIGRAAEAFRDRPRWRALQRNAMARDFSWDVSAREYVKVYRGQKS